MTTHLHHLPEVVRRWHNLAQGVVPATRMSSLPFLLDSATKLAEDLDRAAQLLQRKARLRPAERPVHTSNEASLSQELRELSIALNWVRESRADLLAEQDKKAPLGPIIVQVPVSSAGVSAADRTATAYEGPLSHLEGRLVHLLLERLATARTVLDRQEVTTPCEPVTNEPVGAIEPTLLDFPPPAPRRR